MTKFFRIYSRRINQMLPYIFGIGAMQWLLSVIVSWPMRLLGGRPPGSNPFEYAFSDVNVVSHSFAYVVLGIIMCLSAMVITIAVLRIKDSRCNIEYGITPAKNIIFQLADFVVIAVAVLLIYIIGWLCNSIIVLLNFNDYLLIGSLFSVINTREIFIYIPLFLACIFCGYCSIINAHKMYATNKIYALVTVGVNILIVVLYGMLVTNWLYDANISNKTRDILQNDWVVASVVFVFGLANFVSYALMEKYADVKR